MLAVALRWAVAQRQAVAQLTSTRLRGSFQATVLLVADGGSGALSATCDTAICPSSPHEQVRDGVSSDSQRTKP
jgi:hypothetical protein